LEVAPIAPTKKLPKVTESILTLGLVGYILRIIPLLEIIGFILTGILWLYIYRAWRKTYFLIVSILMFVTVASIIVSNIYSLTTFNIETVAPETTAEAIEYVNKTYEQMMSQITVISMVNNGVQVITIFLEAIGFLILYRSFPSVFRPYTFILLIMLGITIIGGVIAMYVSLANLKTLLNEMIESFRKGEAIESPAIELRMFNALTPMVIAGIVLLIIKVVGYVMCALTVNRYKKKLLEQEVMLKEVPPPPPPI